MAIVTNIVGDLLLSDTDFIVHQINSVVVKPHGLSAAIAAKWPWACRYAQRRQDGSRNLAIEEDHDAPGSVVLMQPPIGVKAPIVVGLVGQYEMGRPLAYNRGLPLSSQDTKINREEWFLQGLNKLAVIMRATKKYSAAFPKYIGSALAGGCWASYNRMISEDFARLVPEAEIRIIELPKC